MKSGPEWVLLAGSVGRMPLAEPNGPGAVRGWRRACALIRRAADDGAIRIDGERTDVLRDIPCSTPSRAATLMTGASRNGWADFRLPDGRPLSAIRG